MGHDSSSPHGAAKRHTRAIVVVVAAVALVAGCGVKSPPQPPVVRVADPTRDLTVDQEGWQAVLRWSYPSSTTAGEPLPDLEAVEVWRLTVLVAEAPPPGQTPRDRNLNRQLIESNGERLTVLDRNGLEQATRGPSLEWRDGLEVWRRDHPGEAPQMVWYAVRSVCCRGRASALSNIVRLAPEPPPPPPTGFELEPEPAGIRVTWVPREELSVIVERSHDDDSWRQVSQGELASDSWLDTGAVQNAAWSYRLRSVRLRGQAPRVVGDPGPAVAVDYPDVYPPAAPDDLVCLPEGSKVRLRWRAVAEAEHYRVARSADGRPAQVLATELRSIQYDDDAPPAGGLLYRVTTVDAAGNESVAATCSAARSEAP